MATGCAEDGLALGRALLLPLLLYALSSTDLATGLSDDLSRGAKGRRIPFATLDTGCHMLQ